MGTKKKSSESSGKPAVEQTKGGLAIGLKSAMEADDASESADRHRIHTLMNLGFAATKLASLPRQLASSLITSVVVGSSASNPPSTPPDFATQFASKVGVTRDVVLQLDTPLISRIGSEMRTSLRTNDHFEIDADSLRSLVLSYFTVRMWKTYLSLPTGIQFERELSGNIVDVSAKVNGYDCFIVVLPKGHEHEGKTEYEETYQRLFETIKPLEGWIVSDSKEDSERKLDPVQIWENMYMFPIVRAISLRSIFGFYFQEGEVLDTRIQLTASGGAALTKIPRESVTSKEVASSPSGLISVQH